MMTEKRMATVGGLVLAMYVNAGHRVWFLSIFRESGTRRMDTLGRYAREKISQEPNLDIWPK